MKINLFVTVIILFICELHSQNFNLENIDKSKFYSEFNVKGHIEDLTLNPDIFYYNYNDLNIVIENKDTMLEINFENKKYNIDSLINISRIDYFENFLIISFIRDNSEKFCIFNLINKRFKIFDKLLYETQNIGLINHKSKLILRDLSSKYFIVNEDNISEIDTLCNFELNQWGIDQNDIPILKENIVLYLDSLILLNNTKIDTFKFHMNFWVIDLLIKDYNCNDDRYDEKIFDRIVQGYPYTWGFRNKQCIVNLESIKLNKYQLKIYGGKIYLLTDYVLDGEKQFRIYEFTNTNKLKLILDSQQFGSRNIIDNSIVSNFEIYKDLIFLEINISDQNENSETKLKHEPTVKFLKVYDLNKNEYIKLPKIINK